MDEPDDPQVPDAPETLLEEGAGTSPTQVREPPPPDPRSLRAPETVIEESARLALGGDPADSRRFQPQDTEVHDPAGLPPLGAPPPDSRRFQPQDTEVHDPAGLPPLGAPPPDSRRFQPPETVIQDSERVPQVEGDSGTAKTLIKAPPQAPGSPDTGRGGGFAVDDDGLPASGRVAHYELRRELARGGMGAVYLAYHPRLKREVALKVMLAGRDASTKQLARFQREAEAAGRLQHPGIVAVHDVGQDRGLHYLVMDLVQGPSLDRVIKDAGPLPLRQAAEVTRALAEALGYAHSRAILHRDMKPANVLLDPEGRPRITDFGLAKNLDVEDELTKAGSIMGTPAYMPPEQARGDVQAIDRRADLYSLGATLYAMLTGKAPFKGKPVNVIYQVLRVDPVAPSKLRPDLDRDLETICLRCMEKDPLQRYATAQDLADDLARYLAHEPILARRPGLAERAQKWVRRNRALATVLASAALLLVAVGGGAL
ncbi:MAG: serine/threonine protein kinase, partial [Planctomycetes bacterium]|nr:serine/threonine protein kinase [Planctomycetota bacterium]